MATSKKTTVPATAKQPQDRQAKAVEAEALDVDPTFEWGGVEYTLNRRAAQSVQFLQAVEEDRGIACLRLLLGDEQWNAWLEHSAVDGFTPAETLGEFMEAATRVAVGDPGNSEASPTS